jgi:hypothetical protein
VEATTVFFEQMALRSKTTGAVANRINWVAQTHQTNGQEAFDGSIGWLPFITNVLLTSTTISLSLTFPYTSQPYDKQR